MSSKFTLDNFANPPQKVLQMFAAVTDLVAEHADFSTMKVQDITAKAGIGKGTAYEYFSSKEELITLALFHDYGMKITELKALVDAQDNFEKSVYCVLDWMHDNQSYHNTFVHMLQISSGSQNFCKILEDHISKEIFEDMHIYLMSACDALMEQGYQEGLYKEKDVAKRRMAFATMIIQAVLTMGPKRENAFFTMDYATVRTYSYETLIKTLA